MTADPIADDRLRALPEYREAVERVNALAEADINQWYAAWAAMADGLLVFGRAAAQLAVEERATDAPSTPESGG